MNADETLSRWRAEEQAARARLAAATGYARPDQVAGRTGLEMFEAIFAGELPRPPIGGWTSYRSTSKPALPSFKVARS
jgi:hypothetical protein